MVVMLGFATTDLYAQSEVRGVETKLVTYEGSEYQNWIQVGYRTVEENHNEWFGFEFYNMNSIPVSLDVQLCYTGNYNQKHIATKKTFVLNSQESYIWKFEDNSDFRVFNNGNQRIKPYNYYVEYKAYKLE